MKKKSLAAITILLILALSLTGCGKKTNNTPNTSDNPTQTEKADASGAYEETEVDMEKVDGNEITSMTEKNDYDGKLGNYDVSIGDAKTVSSDDADIIIISFDFKNNSGSETAFTSAIDVEVTQDGATLPGAVVTNTEGVNLLSMAERIQSGDKITVQRAYRLRDTSLPVEVTAKEFGSSDDEILTKTFDF